MPADIQSKWALIATVIDHDDQKRAELADFAKWYIKSVRIEGAKIGHYFNYEEKPVTIVETVVNDMESCTNAYQSIQKNYPQVVLVVHILPQPSSQEYEWMKILAQRYGFVRQGILYENAIKRFETADLSPQIAMRNMCQWIYRSGVGLSRSEGNACGILVGEDSKPTIEKLLFNPEDIKQSVISVLHGDEDPKGAEADNCVRIEGFPKNLNTFGVAQLIAPYRVLGVTMNDTDVATVTLENKYQVFQAVSDFDGKVTDRNHVLKLTALGQDVADKMATIKLH